MSKAIFRPFHVDVEGVQMAEFIDCHHFYVSQQSILQTITYHLAAINYS